VRVVFDKEDAGARTSSAAGLGHSP
jgi:hypothetical protein